MKPKLLLYRPPLDNVSNHFKDAGFLNRENGLRLHFELTLIETNFDLKEHIEQYQPDLILFVYEPVGHKDWFKIKNADYKTEIPRIALTAVDAISPYRWNVIYTMEKLGVIAYFTHDTSFGAYYPAFKNKIYHWHEFIDPAVFKDYQLEKKYDILMIGSYISPDYPWRKKIKPIIKKHFNYFELTHWDRDNPNQEKKSLVKEDYSKMINQAKITPTCGGHGRIFIGKMIEIPASASCMIIEKVECLKDMGYIDMHNCVFADETNFEEKANFLLNNPDILNKITSEGLKHVLNNHTALQRTEIVDWFNLFKLKNENQKIVQQSLLKGLKLVPIDSKEENYHIYDALPIGLCKKGDVFLFKNEFDSAKKYYSEIFDLCDYLPNYLIRIAIIHLMEKKPFDALRSLHRTIEFEIMDTKGDMIDPVELFVIMLALIIEKQYYLVLKIVLYAETKVANVIHFEIIKNILFQNKLVDGAKYYHKSKLTESNYSFISSHEFLNKSTDELVNFTSLVLEKNNRDVLMKNIKQLNSYTLIDNVELPTFEWKEISEFTFKLSKYDLVKMKFKKIISKILPY